MAAADLYLQMNPQFSAPINVNDFYNTEAEAITYAAGLIGATTAAWAGQTVSWKDVTGRTLTGVIQPDGTISRNKPEFEEFDLTSQIDGVTNTFNIDASITANTPILVNYAGQTLVLGTNYTIDFVAHTITILSETPIDSLNNRRLILYATNTGFGSQGEVVVQTSGTWTINDESLSSQSARWVKQGNLVHIFITCEWSGTAGLYNSWQIPYTVPAPKNEVPLYGIFSSLSGTDNVSIVARTTKISTLPYLMVYYPEDSPTSGIFMISGTYETN